MSERNAPPDQPDLFERELDARLKTWRADAPSPHLKTRIATAVHGTVSPRGVLPSGWRHALVAGACLVIVCVALLCLSLQPPPTFARVEEAMKSVKHISYRSQSDRTLPDGATERVLTDTWLRRTPPTFADRVVIEVEGKERNQKETIMRQRRVTDTRQRVTLDELTGARKVSANFPGLNIAKSVELHFYAFTHPSNDHPYLAAHYQKDVTTTLSPWRFKSEVLDGKPVWVFTRTTRAEKFSNKWGEKEVTATVRIWADAATRRVVHKETVHEFGDGKKPIRIVTTDYRYDQPPPPGTFDLKPAKKASPKKAK